MRPNFPQQKNQIPLCGLTELCTVRSEPGASPLRQTPCGNPPPPLITTPPRPDLTHQARFTGGLRGPERGRIPRAPRIGPAPRPAGDEGPHFRQKAGDRSRLEPLPSEFVLFCGD